MKLNETPLISKEMTTGNYYELENLKILIVSTAKTGNTWVKHLFSTIYDLPVVAPTNNLDTIGTAQNTTRWIAQIHFDYDPKIAEWAEKNRVVLITTLRHPGDTLVSLFHYFEKCPEDFPPTLMKYLFFKNGEQEVNLEFGMAPEKLQSSIEFVKQYFPSQLKISLDWFESGHSNGVRYEDLWRDPLTVLQNLTGKIHPVSTERLERAIEQCDIKMLREVAGRPLFFRNGRPGDWTREMAPELIDVLKNFEPYPSMFSRLGYTLDPADPLITAPAKTLNFTNPFQEIKHFDNGVPVAPIIARLFQSIEPELLRDWPAVENTGAGKSFYSWLNEPSRLDPYRERDLPLVSNLAAGIYKLRTDYQAVFPDLYGRNRLDFILWFRAQVREEYHLAAAFVDPIMDSLLNWSVTNNEPDNPSPLIITRLAAYIYNTRPELQSLYPDIHGKDRGSFLLWLLVYAPQAYRLGPEFFQPVHDSFKDWSMHQAQEETIRGKDVPPLTNLLLCIYQARPDYQAAFPDLFNMPGRANFLNWFRENGYQEYSQLDWNLVM